MRWLRGSRKKCARELEKHFGTEEVHEAGLRVDTTLDLDLQQTANRAVADGLAAYERRHGWRGKLENVLAAGATLDSLPPSRLGRHGRPRRLRSRAGHARASA